MTRKNVIAFSLREIAKTVAHPKRSGKMTDKIKLVSERDPNEIAAQHAGTELSGATRELAANILRIIAGAGKTYTLIGQVEAVLAAHEKLKKNAHPLAPEFAMDKALRSDWHAERAKDDIVQAALRLAAAQLCAQATPESQSDNQLLGAIRQYNESRKSRRR
jgi:hypothetical protein